MFWQAPSRCGSSTARLPGGCCVPLALYVFSHDSALGQCTAQQLFERDRRDARKPEVVAPRAFGDYEVHVRRRSSRRGEPHQAGGVEEMCRLHSGGPQRGGSADRNEVRSRPLSTQLLPPSSAPLDPCRTTFEEEVFTMRGQRVTSAVHSGESRLSRVCVFGGSAMSVPRDRESPTRRVPADALPGRYEVGAAGSPWRPPRSAPGALPREMLARAGGQGSLFFWRPPSHEVVFDSACAVPHQDDRRHPSLLQTQGYPGPE